MEGDSIMNDFRVYAPDDAPEPARPLLMGAQRKLGFIPELYARMAESPPALQAYFDLSARFEQTTFLPAERQVLLLTISVETM